MKVRRIVSCAECHRQFDASGKRPGTRFRCPCGAAVEVRPARGHDAAVVRCSSCGAPRVAQSSACGHCGSDYTLHELDLHTVCPQCLARVSDRARYCHHCACPLIGDAVTWKKSRYACPLCQPRRRLVSRRIADYRLAMLECPSCVGTWLSIHEMHALFEYESRRPGAAIVRTTWSAKKSPSKGYRPCVVCHALMARRNFGRGASGVILDICGDHGIWFDPDELGQLIAWTRAGGLEEARLDLARMSGASDPVRRRIATERDGAARGLRDRIAAPSPKEPEILLRRPAPSQTADWLANVLHVVSVLLTRR